MRESSGCLDVTRGLFLISLCILCVFCVSVVNWGQKTDHHRDTENIEIVQRSTKSFQALPKLNKRNLLKILRNLKNNVINLERNVRKLHRNARAIR